MREPKVKRQTEKGIEIYYLQGNWNRDHFETLKTEAKTGDGGTLMVRNKNGVTMRVHINELLWDERD